MDQLFRAKDQTTNLRQTQIPKAKVYSPMSLCQENGKMSVYRCVKPSIRIHARIRPDALSSFSCDGRRAIVLLTYPGPMSFSAAQ